MAYSGLALCLCVPGVSAAPESRRNLKDRQTYVRIPAGSFRMGCSDGDKECYEDERPAHTVRISNDFWMGQTEVTVALTNVTAAAAGAQHTCAIAGGTTLCWGLNQSGQLGADLHGPTSTATPTPISGL